MRRIGMGWWIAALSLVMFAPQVRATNGMYLAAYGSEAAGRGGADLAYTDHASCLQSNPAALAFMKHSDLTIDLQVLAPKLTYGGDPFGNAITGKNNLFPMPSISWAHASPKSPLAFGLGLISQGGMGAQFDGYATPFGTKDGTYSQVRFASLTPAIAYAVAPTLALGVSANLGYSDVAFRFYPTTSYYNTMGTPLDPTDDVGFFGADLSKAARAFNSSVRVGALWSVHPRMQIGAIYQTKTSGEYKNGTLTLNESSLGLGLVKYDAVVDGFTWPAQWGIGTRIEVAPRLTLAGDLRRDLWSDAIQDIQVMGSKPDKASPVTAPVMPFVFDWQDVWVGSVGAEFKATPALVVRAGWNYGEDPVPAATLNPLFPAITERHATLGCGWTRGANTLNVAAERAFATTLTNPNTNPNVNPFGPGATVTHSQWTFSLGWSRAL